MEDENSITCPSCGCQFIPRTWVDRVIQNYKKTWESEARRVQLTAIGGFRGVAFLLGVVVGLLISVC